MRLTIDIPDEFDDIVLEAFGQPELNTPIHGGPYIPATQAEVEERLKNTVRSTVYAYIDNKSLVQTTRNRSEEKW